MKNTEKTVIEWLNEAKEQGYEWADDAIALHQKSRSSKEANIETSLSEALASAFHWATGQQPFIYWGDIYFSLQEKGL